MCLCFIFQCEQLLSSKQSSLVVGTVTLKIHSWLLPHDRQARTASSSSPISNTNEYLGFTNTFAYRQVHRTWCIVIWPIGSSYWCNIWEFCNPPSITGTSGKLGHWVDSKYISNVFSPECKAMKFQSILIGMRWIFSIESWQLGWYRCNQCCITSINCPLSQNNTEVSQWSRVTKDILPAIFLSPPSLLMPHCQSMKIPSKTGRSRRSDS